MISKDDKLNLDKTLFWDTNFETLDADKYVRHVIERVLTRGSLDEWYQIRDYYGLEKIKKEVVMIRSMDPVSLNFWSDMFDIPIDKFTSFETVKTNPYFQRYYE